MGELSDRFADLMARMARSDADLFRTLGEQNASVRQLVDDLTTAPGQPPSPPPAAVALAAASLLPPEECALPALKARFRRIAEAQAWLEERLGPPPKKPSWAVLEQTFRSGTWPVASKGTAKASALTTVELDQRLEAMEQRLQQRLGHLEELLARLLECALRG
ncbi:MAG: hypothetical protein RLZZ124_1661 [Cyanobacteriota bacterium]